MCVAACLAVSRCRWIASSSSVPIERLENMIGLTPSSAFCTASMPTSTWVGSSGSSHSTEGTVRSP